MAVLLALCFTQEETRTTWLPAEPLYPHPIADPRGPFTGSRAQLPLEEGNNKLENAFGLEQPFVRVEWDEAAVELGGEGGVVSRFDLQESLDMDGADFRFGFPLSYRRGALALKLHPWHITSHLGDEYIEREGVFRIEYARNELALGAAWRLHEAWRVYAEGGYGFSIGDPNEPWRVMGGVEFVDALLPGAPDVYLAANLQAWEETDWTPQFNAQAGVWIRSEETPSGLRVGLEYFRGPSALTQFFLEKDHSVSFGFWIHF
jgi:hypothetical protein